MLDAAEKTIGSLAILIILVLVSMQVIQRVTSGTSFAWSGEIAKYAMIWMTYVPMAYLLRRGLHLKLDVIDQWLSPRAEAIMSRITDALIGLIALGLVAAGYALLTTPALGTSPAARIPLALVYAGPVIGLFLLAVCALYLAAAGRTAEEPVAADLEPVIGEIGEDGRVDGGTSAGPKISPTSPVDGGTSVGPEIPRSSRVDGGPSVESDPSGSAGGTGEIGEARP